MAFSSVSFGMTFLRMFSLIASWGLTNLIPILVPEKSDYLTVLPNLNSSEIFDRGPYFACGVTSRPSQLGQRSALSCRPPALLLMAKPNFHGLGG